MSENRLRVEVRVNPRALMEGQRINPANRTAVVEAFKERILDYMWINHRDYDITVKTDHALSIREGYRLTVTGTDLNSKYVRKIQIEIEHIWKSFKWGEELA